MGGALPSTEGGGGGFQSDSYEVLIAHKPLKDYYRVYARLRPPDVMISAMPRVTT